MGGLFLYDRRSKNSHTLPVKICDVDGTSRRRRRCRRSIRTHQQPSPITGRQMELEKIEKDAFRGHIMRQQHPTSRSLSPRSRALNDDPVRANRCGTISSR